MTDEYVPDISWDQIIKVADDFIKTSSSRNSAFEAVVNLLHASVPYYDWVGIYVLNSKDELLLGPYRGDESPHSTIPVARGVCGAAVREKQTIIVPDVNNDSRYLACSLETKSEIVVPIIAKGAVRGEIDIDSHTIDAFGTADKDFLEAIAVKLSELFR